MTDAEYFKITRLHRDDIKQAMDSHELLTPKMEETIDTLSDADMELLGNKMGNDYVEQLFWDSLYVLFTDLILPRIQGDEKEE